MIDSNLKLSKIYVVDSDGNESELKGVTSIEPDLDENDSECFMLSDGNVSFDIETKIIKDFHRIKKGKRYIITYYEEYDLFDDFKAQAFGVKEKYKKIKRLGGKGE